MNKKIKLILVTIAAVFLVSAVRTGMLIAEYPEVDIAVADILNEQSAELSNLTVDNGVLFAESNNPEILITLPETVPVYEIGVRIDSVSRANCRSYLYLSPSYDETSILIKKGMNYWRFGNGAAAGETSQIRFYPVPLRGVSLAIGSFTINPHGNFILSGLRNWIIVAAVLAVLESILCALLARYHRNGGWYQSCGGIIASAIAGAAQAAFTVGFLDAYVHERHSWDTFQTVFYFTCFITESLYVLLTYLPDEMPTLGSLLGAGRDGAVAADTGRTDGTVNAKQNSGVSGIDENRDQGAGQTASMVLQRSLWTKRELPIIRIALLSIMSYALTETLYGDYMQHWKWIAILCNPLAYSLLYVLFHMIPFPRRFHLTGLCYALPNVLWMLAAGVNHYYFEFRAQALEFADISMAGTAGNVMGTYTLDVTPTVFLMYASAASIVLASLTESHRNWRRTTLTRELVSVVYLMIAAIFLWTHAPKVSLWNTNTATKYNGYVYSFLSYMKKSLERPEPDNYFAEHANEILAQYAEDAASGSGDGVKSEADLAAGADRDGIEASNGSDSAAATGSTQAVNLIVVMDEAFADLPTTYGFETNVDGLPYIHSLAGSNVKKGNLMVSVFGGTTADSEYEFLTGNSLAFLNADSVPYTQYIDSDQQSLASMFTARGVYATAFHPYLPNGYKRNKIYPLLGFPQFVSSENDLPYYDKIRSYVSDVSDIEDLIDIWNNNRSGGAETAADGSGELTGNTVDASGGQFLFNVTMQNHGNYNSTESTVEVTVEPTDARLRTPQLEEYLSLAYATDQAFAQLIEYYETVDEPTIILLFGDHQPGLDESVYKKINPAMYEEDAPIEERQKKYTVPYVIWANYDLPDLGDGDGLAVTSCNLLRSYFLENAGVELSAFDRLCSKVRKTYPAMNIKGFLTTDGEWHDNDDLQEIPLMQDYQNVCYLNLFDQEHMNIEYFE